MKSRGAAALFCCSIALVAASFACSAALGSQTREQCEKCCQSKETDEYWWAPAIERSLVIGDSLYTYSYEGILQSDLETVEPGTYVGFWG